MTEDFQKNKAGKGSLECQRLQLHEWNVGFEDTMKRLDSFILSRRRVPSWKNKLVSFNRATIGAAVNILNSEFVRFGTRSDPRRMDPVTRKKDKSKREPAYLQLEASEVTPEFLASNVIGDVTSQFKEHMPHLWYILSVLTRNDSHNYRERQRSPLPKEEDRRPSRHTYSSHGREHVILLLEP